ncbi:hypothetical protein SJAG_04171 [Schizosaccharomyces japonicus yFS275]|uniref:3'-5' exonuclease domain-containing protein n=1 Tax=Schizosaccharomyces japonicus (strain yFS275 / FY16936) TaxID=402676 RepID=B6K643_SCHJY|nr:hypothetical protein SJAG_04171 [Schizosaccharomyces japonicus yFS275]EEB08997.1 hypothetical protein SJAG_04171 [Schizosaccharomyces japonicus yFS275]
MLRVLKNRKVICDSVHSRLASSLRSNTTHQVPTSASLRSLNSVSLATMSKMPPPIEYNIVLPRLGRSFLRKDWSLPNQQQTTQGQYWNFQTAFQNGGTTPRVVYVNSEAGLNKYMHELQSSPVLGFDMEWTYRTPVSMIQICTSKLILLVHLTRMRIYSPEYFPRRLKELMESPDHIKCGVAIQGDATRLLKAFQVSSKGLCELSRYARAVDPETWIGNPRTSGNRLIALTKLAHQYLGLPLDKGPVQVSNWDQGKLKASQLQYAAIDVYASLQIFLELERMRQQKLPQLESYTLDFPFINVPVPKKTASKVRSA